MTGRARPKGFVGIVASLDEKAPVPDIFLDPPSEDLEKTHAPEPPPAWLTGAVRNLTTQET